VTTWAVVASGESVTAAVAARVRHLPCVAVSDGFKLAPWARALVSSDSPWWRKTEGALKFAGDKWSMSGFEGTSRIIPHGCIGTHTNSGLVGVDRAVTYYGAKRVLLLGIDMVGTHFFGPHKSLTNTTPERFEFFMAQFAAYAEEMRPGVEIINCSPISALEVFPKRALEDVLEEELCRQ
jgi:hypothetical protein